MMITLTWLEMFDACMVGVARRLESMRKQRDNVLDENQIETAKELNNFQNDIEAAIAEKCFAKHFNLYWSSTINTFSEPDVGDWQVRQTTYPGGHLILRRKDKTPGEHFAFLIVDSETFGARLVGWTTTEEGKADKFWKPDKTSWWVPQSALHHFGETLQQTKGLSNYTPPAPGVLIRCESPQADRWRKYWAAHQIIEPFAVRGGQFFEVPSTEPPHGEG
jgi:hypothetical protein